MFDPWGSNYQARAKVSCGKETWSSVHWVLTPLSNLGNNTLFLAIPDLVSITAPGESPWWGWVHCWLWAGTGRECYCGDVNRILVTRRLLSTFSKTATRFISLFTHCKLFFIQPLTHVSNIHSHDFQIHETDKIFLKSSPSLIFLEQYGRSCESRWVRSYYSPPTISSVPLPYLMLNCRPFLSWKDLKEQSTCFSHLTSFLDELPMRLIAAASSFIENWTRRSWAKPLANASFVWGQEKKQRWIRRWNDDNYNKGYFCGLDNRLDDDLINLVDDRTMMMIMMQMLMLMICTYNTEICVCHAHTITTVVWMVDTQRQKKTEDEFLGSTCACNHTNAVLKSKS